MNAGRRWRFVGSWQMTDLVKSCEMISGDSVRRSTIEIILLLVFMCPAH